MIKTNPAPQAPISPTTTSITSTASATLGSGKGGRWIFKVVGPFAPGTADYEDVTVWITFSTQSGGTPATPVAGTTGYPLTYGVPEQFVLGEGVKFKAISDTTTVDLTYVRVSDE